MYKMRPIISIHVILLIATNNVLVLLIFCVAGQRNDAQGQTKRQKNLKSKTASLNRVAG